MAKLTIKTGRIQSCHPHLQTTPSASHLKIMGSSVFLLCLVVLSLAQAQFSAADLLEQTCKQTPNYDLCVKTLLADPRSSHADVAGLAMVMVDTIKAKAIAATHRIGELLGTAPDPKTKAALGRCVVLYDRAVLGADIPSAKEAVRTGNPKFAEQGANDAANEADSCERAFGGYSPITSFNRGVSDVSRVASAIIRLLL